MKMQPTYLIKAVRDMMLRLSKTFLLATNNHRCYVKNHCKPSKQCQKKLDEMVEMGFDETESYFYLNKFKYDKEQTINYMFDLSNTFAV